MVYAKPAFGGPLQVLRYLGRYTHRVAISNHRLLAFERERVTFRWKDYAHGGKQSRMTLAGTEFLRRFFLHVLPRGFVRIRHFGFLANRFRVSRLALCQQLLACGPQWCKQSEPRKSIPRVPRCGIVPAAAQLCSSFRDSQVRNYPHACTSILPSSSDTNHSGMCASTPTHSCLDLVAIAPFPTFHFTRLPLDP